MIVRRLTFAGHFRKSEQQDLNAIWCDICIVRKCWY